MKPINSLPPFKRLCVTIGNLPSSYVDSMSYYECLMWLCKYLKETVIPAINNNAEAVKEIQEWIENIDLQDEVDNKLDEMAESGELQEIISEYLNSTAIFSFNTVADMKSATNLIDGSTARTLGYYSLNDGGGATYKIRKLTVNDTVDEAFIIRLTDELGAELIIDKNTVSIKQLGARSQDSENHKYDIKTYVEKYITYIANNPDRCRLYIPSGIWYCSPLEITNTRGFDIYGDFGYYNYSLDSTVITSLTDNQPYIFKLGTNTGSYLKNWNLENILFSTYDYAYRSNIKDFVMSTPKKVSQQVIEMVYAIHGKMNNILFINVIGQAMKISACWENIFGYLVFRFVSNPEGSIVCFGKDKTYGDSASISSSDFREMYFESTHGDLMEFNQGCSFTNNHFGVINFEPNAFNYNNLFTYTSITGGGSNIPVGTKHYSMFKLSDGGYMSGNKVDSIELNGFAINIITYNNNNYVYDTIVGSGTGYIYLGLMIDTINSSPTGKNIVIYKNNSTNTPDNTCYLIINNVASSSQYDYIFDVARTFSTIKCGGELFGSGTIKTKLNNNITPFIDSLSRVQANAVYSDSGAINPTKLCCELVRFVSYYNGKFINTGSKLCIRAKIPNGETYTFRLLNDGNYSQNIQCVGTGQFKWYELELNEYMSVFGQELQFKSAGGDNPAGVLLDCYLFKD